MHSFSFDIPLSSMINQLLIFKSTAPELLGEFAPLRPPPSQYASK